MISRLVFALTQRFIVVVAMICLAVWGIFSFQKLPIDAYLDLSSPQVQIVTPRPGHAAEEIERLITIPLEVEMNGIPQLDALRSISLYGLASVTMNFAFDTDPYFAREQAFERIADAQMPAGVTPGMSPLFSPSGLIYRYVLERVRIGPPRSWRSSRTGCSERKYRAIQAGAHDSSLGGETMQGQVQIDPTCSRSDLPAGRWTSSGWPLPARYDKMPAFIVHVHHRAAFWPGRTPLCHGRRLESYVSASPRRSARSAVPDGR